MNYTSDIESQIDRIFAPYDRPDSPGVAVGIVREDTWTWSSNL